MNKINLGDRCLSLLLVILMMIAAALIVNKTIFGYTPGGEKETGSEEMTVIKAISEDPDGTVIINTTGMEHTIDGYAGPVPLEISVLNGKISDIEALPNAESPGFFKRAAVLFDSWIGKTPQEAMEMSVDGVTGATYSSNAIINNVRVGLSEYTGSYAGNASGDVPLKIWIAFAVTLVACIVPLFVKSRIYHNVQLIANIIVLGFWAGQFLDYSLMLKYLSGGFSWPVVLIAVPMLVAAFIYPVFGRPQHYCNHICPLGSAQQLMSEICGYKIKLSPRLIHGLDWFRRILWGVLMLLLWMDCLVGWMDLELFQAFAFQSASWGIIIAAVIFVLLSTVIARPYCRFVCPTGSLFKRSENIG